MVRDQLSPHKPSDSCLEFSRTRVQHSPGSSTIEPPFAPPEYVAYSPLIEHARYACAPCSALPGFTRQFHPPKATKLELGRSARGKDRPNTTKSPPRVNRPQRLNREDSQLAASLEGESTPTLAGKTPPHSFTIVQVPGLQIWCRARNDSACCAMNEKQRRRFAGCRD